MTRLFICCLHPTLHPTCSDNLLLDAKQSFHDLGRLSFALVQNVGIDAECQPNVRVSKDIHSYSCWYTLSGQQGGAGMPEIVETHAR